MCAFHWMRHQCAYCGKPRDGLINMEADTAPAAGDASLCTLCGNWTIFGSDLKPRTATSAELATLSADPMAQRLRADYLERKLSGMLRDHNTTHH